MSELDRLKEQLVYLRFWLGIMVATEIALVGWLISTSINANPTELDRALSAIGNSSAQGIIVTTDPFLFSSRETLIQFAAAKRLPATYFFKQFADAGGLMSYGASLEDSYRRAATYVDKILKGARPTDLPIEQPRHFELVINMKTARALGLKVPQLLLLRADHVIE